MKKSILMKAETLELRASENPVNNDDTNYDFKYFLEYYNTYKVIGRFRTQAEMEDFLDELMERNERLEVEAQRELRSQEDDPEYWAFYSDNLYDDGKEVF